MSCKQLLAEHLPIPFSTNAAGAQILSEMRYRAISRTGEPTSLPWFETHLTPLALTVLSS
jgi:hypothetical protein